MLDTVNPDLDWALSLYSLFARGGEEQMFYGVVAGNPWSKSRPRFANRRAYQPRDDVAAEEALKRWMTARKAPQYTGNVMLACRFYRPNFQRIDADNLLKHVCDSANGVMWKDDSQVTSIFAEVHYDRDNPRTVIVAGNHSSSLLRGSDQQRACEHCGETYLPSVGRRTVQRFCTTRCAYAAAHGVDLNEKVPCKQCGELFRRSTSAQLLCSPECRADSVRGRNRARALPKSNCATCGKPPRTLCGARELLGTRVCDQAPHTGSKHNGAGPKDARADFWGTR